MTTDSEFFFLSKLVLPQKKKLISDASLCFTRYIRGHETMKVVSLTKRGAGLGADVGVPTLVKTTVTPFQVWTCAVYVERDCVYSNHLPKMQK